MIPTNNTYVAVWFLPAKASVIVRFLPVTFHYRMISNSEVAVVWFLPVNLPLSYDF